MHLRPSVPITTDRLLLRPLVLDDVDDLLAYRGDPQVCRFLPFEPMTDEVLRGRLAGDLGRTEITGPGQALTLGVVVQASDRVIGDVVLFFHSLEHRGGELGYVLHPDATGRGYATEACRAVLDLAFHDLGLHRVVARLDSRNTASARVAERLGMRQEAHLVQNEWFKGEWSDELQYAVLEQEWADPGPQPA